MGLQKAQNYVHVDTPNPYEADLQTAFELLQREIDETQGWEGREEKDDVILEKKLLPGAAAGDLPITRGTCIIEGITTDAIVPLIQAPGIRRKWDPRFQDAWILRRFSSAAYQFYSLGNSPPGMGWLISPRDLSGAHQQYYEGKKDESLAGQGKEIILIQVGIKDDERASEQSGRTRMKLSLSGWRLRPQGDDVKVTYIVKVSLGGSIPKSAVATILKDLPTCAGKLRNTYYEFGYPPYIVQPSSLSAAAQSIQENEVFHFGPTKSGAHEPLPNDKHGHLYVTGKDGGDFEVRYDVKRMYNKEGGVHVTVRGEGKDGVTTVDDGTGTVSVRVGQAADGKRFEIIISPKGKKVVAPDS